MPEFYPADESDPSSLATICIDQQRRMVLEAPVFAYTGDHMCWVTPFTMEKSIFIFNIKTRVLRKFDASRYMACDDGGNYLVNACDPVQLLA